MVKDKKLRFQTAEQMRVALSAAGQALGSGQGLDASLPEESPRALPRTGRRTAAYVEGTGALDLSRPEASPRLPPPAPTLSGQAATRVDRMVGRRSVRPAPARRGWPTAALLSLGALATAGLTAGAFFWMRAHLPPPS